jgi:predicted transcriptional regulator
MWCMNTEVYSRRLSRELKTDLEREARQLNAPISSVLERAVREWLKRNGANSRR